MTIKTVCFILEIKSVIYMWNGNILQEGISASHRQFQRERGQIYPEDAACCKLKLNYC